MGVLVQFVSGVAAHAGVRRYGENSAWLLLEKVLRLLLGFTVGVYVARQLGPAQYGLLNYAISFAALFGVLVSLGMDSVLVRDLVRRSGGLAGEWMGTAFRLKLAGFAVMMLLIGAVLSLSHDLWSTKVLILIVSGGYAFQTLGVAELYFRSRVQAKYAVIAQIAALTAVSLMRILLVWYRAPLWWFALAEALYMALAGGGYWLFFAARANRRERYWPFRARIAGRLLRDSWPYLLSGCAVMFYMRIDQLMVRGFLGDGEVGIYAVAVRLVELLFFVPGVICSSFLPALVNAREISPELYLKRLRYLFALTFYMALMLVIVVYAASPLIVWLYGEAYSGSVAIVRIYALVLFFVYTGSPVSSWTVIENLQKYYLFLTVLNALLNVGFNWVLIPRFGVNGAAWATVATYLVSYAAALGIPALRGIYIERSIAPFMPSTFRKERAD